MRIFISALLLALTGNKKDPGCGDGGELTDSFIPAGLQVANHYLTQILDEINRNSTLDPGRRISGYRAEGLPAAPTIEITYDSGNATSSNDNRSGFKMLTNLSWALNREAKDQALESCKGLSSDVLTDLERSSKLSAKEQLRYVLKRISSGVIRKTESKAWVGKVVAELDDDGSNLNRDLKCVKPLRYIADSSLE